MVTIDSLYNGTIADPLQTLFLLNRVPDLHFPKTKLHVARQYSRLS